MLNHIANTNEGLVREKNEDSYRVVTNKLGHQVFVVADGMGGHKAGEVASKIACELIEKSFAEIDEPINYKEYIKSVISKANEKIYTKSLFKDEYQNMGTTVSMMIFADGKLYTGHVGDSQIFYITPEKIRKITKDHTLVQMLIDNGNLTVEQSKKSNYKNVLIQSLGTNKNLVIEVKEMELPKKFKFLVCSDGIGEKFEKEKLKEFVNLNISLEQRSELIMDYGLIVDGRDNITFILIEQQEQEKNGDQ